MRLTEITLQNFKSFEKFSMTFDPSFTLCVGKNGAGKSSLLRACALALSSWVQAFGDGYILPLDDDDIRRVLRQRNAYQSLDPCLPLEISIQAQLNGRIHWSLKVSGSDMNSLQVHRNSAPLAQTHASQLGSGAQVHLPLVAYFSTNRSQSSGLKPTDDDLKDQLVTPARAYQHALKEPRLFDVTAWMRWRELARTQKLSSTLDPHALLMALQSLNNANLDVAKDLLSLLSHGAEAPELTAIERAVCKALENCERFFYHVPSQELRVQLAGDQVVSFDMLSDGQKRIVTLVASLAWMAHRLNPHFGAEAAERVEGVVLIDEIDLHLHPAWQRRVIGDLRRVFPRLQFIATTHSPQVISTAKPEWLRVLVPGEERAREVKHVEGRDSNSLLADVFEVGARPEGVQQELDALFRLLDQDQYDEARRQFEGLSRQLGPDDPAIIEARWLLERAALEPALGEDA